MTKSAFIKMFAECRTAEDAKKVYKTLARKYHPDCGGNNEDMKALNLAFEEVFEKLKNTFRTKEGKFYQKANTETAGAFMDIINALIKLEGITIEICGTFIWVTGDTKPVKDSLKALGLRYSGDKKAWYKAPDNYKRKSSERWSMEAIRSAFGSQVVKEKEEEKKGTALALN